MSDKTSIIQKSKVSTITALAADTAEIACDRAINSMSLLLRSTGDKDLRVVLRRMIRAIRKAPAESRAWLETAEAAMTEQTNPMDASAVAFAGALAAAVTDIARSLVKVKIQRDRLLEVARHYANPDNYDRGRIFRPCTKEESEQLGKDRCWDAGHTARQAVEDIASTWMPLGGVMEEPWCWNDAANFDELLPPFHGCTVRVPKGDGEVANKVCGAGSLRLIVPSNIEEY